MNITILLYSFFVTTLLGITTFSTASSTQEYIFASLFLPLPIYFLSRILTLQVRNARLKNLKKAQTVQTSPKSLIHKEIAIEGEVVHNPTIKDIDKRLFLKLIGSGGITLFLMSIFTKKTHAAFFGSVPGPGTVAIKDSTGTPIDPAEKQPTDGFEIAQLDDTSSSEYAWYGFVNKNGGWYIMQEDLTGSDAGTYLYATGSSSFSTNWAERSSPISYTFNTFDNTF